MVHIIIINFITILVKITDKSIKIKSEKIYKNLKLLLSSYYA